MDRRPLPGRDFRFELEPRNVFVGVSARIIRGLLTDRDRVWTQKDLVARTKASSGLVSSNTSSTRVSSKRTVHVSSALATRWDSLTPG